MIKVRERKKNGVGSSFDSLIVEIPKDFALSHGLPERSLASLTVEKGKLISEVIEYTADDEAEIEEFISEFAGIDAEMKQIGD